MSEGFEINKFFSEYLLPWTLNIGLALLIFFGGRFAAKLVIQLLRRIMLRGRMELTLVNFLCTTLKFILMAFIVITALDCLGIATTSLIALLGAAGLAVGLALQGTLQNFSAGVMLITFRPFRNGDYVEAGGGSGFVENIGIFKTNLRTLSNVKLIVPNSSIFSGLIKNYTTNGTLRIDMLISISYGDDIPKAKQIIKEVLEQDNRVLEKPMPTINVAELGEYGIKLNVWPWIQSRGTTYWDIKFDLTEKIKLALDTHGVTIPFPQMDVHIDKAE